MAQGLTTAEVMRRLSVKDPDTVYALGRANKIRGGRLRRQWRWDEESVNDFLRGGAVGTSPGSRRPATLKLPAVPDRIGNRRAANARCL